MVVEYDGTLYHGMQVQPNGHTVQAEVERCIEKLTGAKVSLLFAGRTDAGVHALGQVIAFDTRSTIPPHRWQYALNSVLPNDIRVIESQETTDRFHPRFDAIRKIYRYRIYRDVKGQTFYRHHALCCADILDLEKMQAAAQNLEGTHSFRSFCASGSAVKSFERTVQFCRCMDRHPFLDLEMAADGFVYNMVRIIAGTLLEVGRGNLSPEDIPAIISAQDRSQAGPTAPPRGLYLVEVCYPNDLADSK